MTDVTVLRTAVQTSCGWRCNGRLIASEGYERLSQAERTDYEWAADEEALEDLIEAELDAYSQDDRVRTY